MQRKYFAEEFVEAEDLIDYKFFCFNGEPKFLMLATERKTGVRFDFLDLDFNHLPFRQQNDILSDKQLKKPKNFEKMIEIASKLSSNIPHVRVDLYNIDGKIYFGEMTFFNNSGYEPFVPSCWDYKIGQYINLPNKILDNE